MILDARMDAGRGEPRPLAAGVAGIVLAAGASSRMRGVNKLLLPIRGVALVRRAARAVVDAGLAPAVVVVRSDAWEMAAILADLDCQLVLNDRSELGGAHSLQLALERLPPTVSAAVVTLADMPAVTVGMLRRLAAEHRRTGAPLVVSRYGTQEAPPVLFGRGLFARLAPSGDRPGRRVLRARPGEAVVVDWEAWRLMDVDTSEAYEAAVARLERPGAGAGDA